MTEQREESPQGHELAARRPRARPAPDDRAAAASRCAARRRRERRVDEQRRDVRRQAARRRRTTSSTARGDYKRRPGLRPHQADAGRPRRRLGPPARPAATSGSSRMHPGWVETPGVATHLPTFNRISRPGAARRRRTARTPRSGWWPPGPTRSRRTSGTTAPSVRRRSAGSAGRSPATCAASSTYVTEATGTPDSLGLTDCAAMTTRATQDDARRADALALEPERLRRHPRPGRATQIRRCCSPPRGGRRAAATPSRRTSSSPSAGAPSHQVLVRHLSRGNSRLGAARLAGARRRRPVRPRRGGRGRLQAGARRLRHRPGRRPRHAAGAARWACTPTSSPGFDKEAVAAELGVPPYVRLLAGIAIGVRGDPADVPERDAERDHRVRRREPLGRACARRPLGRPVAGLGAVSGRRMLTVALVVFIAFDHQLPDGCTAPTCDWQLDRAGSTSSPR